jgi:hypothetical protein
MTKIDCGANHSPKHKRKLKCSSVKSKNVPTHFGAYRGISMTVIVPTIGRVVWVIRPTETLDIHQPEVGFVTYVHGDGRYINVAGFNSNGEPFKLTSLWLAQDGEAKPQHNFACWMPYQKGQAAKTEALEKQATAGA